MATADNDSYELLQCTTTPADQPNYMRVIREPDYLLVVGDPDLLQELNCIQVIDDPSQTQVTEESNYLQFVHEPDYLQVVDEPEQVVGTTLTILGKNVSCDDNDGYRQPVDRNGYLKPVDVMHNNEQHYQTATTSSAYQVRRNESFKQTLNSANQAINVDVDYEPLGTKTPIYFARLVQLHIVV
jgi:hypothetical protein